MRGMEFVAVDFETANGSRASVCQVGVARVVDGVVVEQHCWPVVPPTGIDSFVATNVRVHGITAEAVRGGMSWAEAAERLAGLVGSAPVVAHNAAFDAGVYDEACFHSDLAPAMWDWVDSLDLARRFVDANRHDLPAVAHALGLPPFQHHDAGADAAATAQVVLELGRRFGARTLGELLDTWPAESERVVASLPQKARRGAAVDDTGSSIRVKDMPQANPDANPGHPLHGHRVVITGALDGYTRMEAWTQLASLGAQPQKGVRKDTTVLVVTEAHVIDTDFPTHLATEKVRKAARYIAAGQQLVVITGRELLACMDPAAPAALPALRQLPVAPDTPAKPRARAAGATKATARPTTPRTVSAEGPTAQPTTTQGSHTVGERAVSPPPVQTHAASLGRTPARAGAGRAWAIFASLLLGGFLVAAIPGIGPLLTLAVWVWAGWKLVVDLRAVKAARSSDAGDESQDPGDGEGA